ncbi:ADAM metallopeptidase with thrombospondin type 1 motif [Mactra antiquata]
MSICILVNTKKMGTLTRCGVLFVTLVIQSASINALFDHSFLEGLEEIENAKVEHKIHHVTRKRSVTEGSTSGIIHTTVTSDQHDVLLTFKRSEQQRQCPIFHSTGRKIFKENCLTSYEDLSNNAHCIVDSCSDNEDLQMMAEVIINDELYVILPSQRSNDSTGQQHRFFKVPTAPLDFTNDYIELEPSKKTDRSSTGRVRRQDPSYIVEVAFVIDFKMYTFWYDLTAGTSVERDIKVIEYINQYYTFLAKGINYRFNSLTTHDLTMTVELVGIYIIKTEGEATFATGADYTSSFRGVLHGESMLPNFNTWVKDQIANNANFPKTADHYTLFTGHDMALNGVVAAAGYAFLGKMCTPESVSLTDQRFNLITGAVAAHELGHSLGGRHDALTTGCSDATGYVLSTTNQAFTNQYKKHPWIFSSCSAAAFKQTIEDLNTGTNCLTTDDIASVADVSLGPGQVFSADRQCEIIIGTGSTLSRHQHQGAYEEICTGMWCIQQTAVSVNLVIPADGTMCGNKKWCMNGECVSSDQAPAGDDSCLYGDQPNKYSINQDCASTLASSPTNCYTPTVVKSCCTSCANAKVSDIPGCEYGDTDSCTGISAGNCYNSNTKTACCHTCKNFEKPNLPSDCLYGDYYSNCDVSACADNRAKCCETCYNAQTTETTVETTKESTTKKTTRAQTTTEFTYTTTERSSGLAGWIIPLVASVGSLVFLGLLAALIAYFCREKRKSDEKRKRRGRSNRRSYQSDIDSYYGKNNTGYNRY